MKMNQKGFTLVELSIVLIIIGLIVGGILVGQELIHQARLRSVIQDIDKFKTAVNIYRMKYNYLPGDQPNTFQFWGSAIGCTNNIVTSNVSGCNGNADGDIEVASGLPMARWENIRAWQVLALEQLIEGSFVSASAGSGPILNTHIPESSVSGVGYAFSNMKEYITAIGVNSLRAFDVPDETRIWVGGVSAAPGSGPFRPGLTAVDVFEIDKKLDDGKPEAGSMFGYTGISNIDYTGDCMSPGPAAFNPNAIYNLSLEGERCAFNIRLN